MMGYVISIALLIVGAMTSNAELVKAAGIFAIAGAIALNFSTLDIRVKGFSELFENKKKDKK